MKRLIIIAAAAAIAAAVSSCGKKTENEEIAIPILETTEQTFNTVTAEIGDISQKYYQDGSYMYPYYEVITFKASGQIRSIEVQDGDCVEEGDLLCTLDSDHVQEQIEEKEIYLRQAQRTLDTLVKNNGSSGEIELAEIDLELQQLEYDRLVDSLEDYNVYAPCSGRLSIANDRGKELFSVYSFVSAGQFFGTAVDSSGQYLCCQIYGEALNDVNFGTKVQITQGVFESSGTVTDIIYNDNGDFSGYIYVITPEEGAELFDFGDVQICFDVYSRLDTVVVPQEAVKTVGDRTFVNLLVDGVKVEQDVELGISDSKNVEVIGGLSGGEELILN